MSLHDRIAFEDDDFDDYAFGSTTSEGHNESVSTSHGGSASNRTYGYSETWAISETRGRGGSPRPLAEEGMEALFDDLKDALLEWLSTGAYTKEELKAVRQKLVTIMDLASPQ